MKRIIIVEDEIIVAIDMQQSLQKLGYKIECISSKGEDAIEKAANYLPDIILMDIMLKGKMDGIEAGKYIYDNYDIPILFVTANSNISILERISDLQFGYVLKPFNIEELKANIEITLNKHNTSKAIKESEQKYRNLYNELLKEIDEKKKIESNLRKSEEKYYKAFHTSPDSISITRLDDGVYLDVNEGFTKLTGYTRDEAVGVSVKDIKIWSNSEDRQKLVNGISKNGEYLGLEAEFKTKDGKILIGLLSGKLIEIDGVKYILSITTDITDRKKAENEKNQLLKKTQELNEELTTSDEELRQSLNKSLELNEKLKNSEAKYRFLIEHGVDGIFIFNSQGFFTDVNTQACNITGYTREELFKMNIQELFDKKELDIKPLLYDVVLRAGNVILERNLIRKDGKLLPVEMNSKKLNDYQIQSFFRDITERKEAEKSRRHNEQLLQHYFELPRIGIAITSTEKKWLKVNNKLCEILGYTKEELNKFKWSDFIPPENYGLINEENYKKILAGEKNDVQFENKFIRKDGTIIDLEVSTVCVRDNKGQAEYFIVTIEDITKKKWAEELKKNYELTKITDEHKQQFIASMSHEMRTPMHGILGMIEFLLKTDLNEKQLDYVQTIKNSSENLLNLINDILDYSKLDAGKMELKPKPFALSALSDKISKLFEALVKQKDIKLKINSSNDINFDIIADEIRITQILTNLVSNAIKFTEKGSITINYKLDKTEGDNLKIKIEVIDTGIGIASDDQKKLFNLFTQLESSYVNHTEGTGLGLVISKKLTEMMNGEIGLISNLNAGSNFWFTFAAKKVKYDTLKLNNDIIDYDNINFNLSVLLVEDTPVISKIISMMLEKAGCRVTIAENGQEAINIFEPDKFNFIFMDIQMPVMDGITAIKILREKYNKLPVIIGVSANAIEGESEKYKTLGMDDYLAKPLSFESLCDKILKWINKP
ncbi:MAG: PAS domain S-box protein [Bacteroidota bacterium]|nr:PAS domain S-box protein [Bacteroidota bacterium]